MTISEPEMLGKEVNNYRLTRLLGEGGMGAVYLGEHTTLGRRVAIKLLRPELGLRKQVTDRFLNEARAANAIRHPNIIEILDLGTIPQLGVPFLIMEYLEGENLAERLKRTGCLSVAEAVDVAQQTAMAIGAAHAKGIVHRDLKPDNLFVVRDEGRHGHQRVKVLDFGIAKLTGEVASLSFRTNSGVLLGTPTYMSPEQCRGIQKDIGHSADIYSLGCILYEMLCGRPPFVSDGLGEVMIMHIEHTPVSLRSRNAAIPESLERAVLRALGKKPQDRFSSMDELRMALDENAGPGAGLHAGTAAVAGPAGASLPFRTLSRLPEARPAPAHLRGSETPSARTLPRRVYRKPGWLAVPLAVAAVAGAVWLTSWLVTRPPGQQDRTARTVQTVSLPVPPPGRGEDEAAKKYLDAAEILAREHRFDPARDMLSKAAKLEIADPDLNIRLASLHDVVTTGALVKEAAGHLGKQEWGRAIESAKQALDRHPQDAEALAIIERADRARAGEKSRPSHPSRDRSRHTRAALAHPPESAPREAATPAAPTPADPASWSSEKGPVLPKHEPPAAPPAAPALAPKPLPEPPRPAGAGTALAPASSGAPAGASPRADQSSPLSLGSGSSIPIPRLPRSYQIGDRDELARICQRIESEAILVGVSADFARGITGPLQRSVNPGGTLYPAGIYYFIVREAALRHDARTAAGNLAAAQRAGLTPFRDLPVHEP